MTAIVLRPRSGSEIVDAAVQLLRANYAALITIAAIAWLPVVAMQLLLRTELSDPGVAYYHTGLYFLSTLVQTMALVVADAASVVIISDAYLGGRHSAGAALARVRPRLGTLIGASIQRNLIGFFGFIFLIVPGLYVIVRTFTLPAIVMCENRDASGSYARAWSLGDGQVGRMLGPAATAGVLYLALTWTLLYFTTRLGISMPVLRTSGVTLVVGNLGSVFFHPLVSVVRTLLYYDLRVRKEGFDVEMMANELATPAVA